MCVSVFVTFTNYVATKQAEPTLPLGTKKENILLIIPQMDSFFHLLFTVKRKQLSTKFSNDWI